MFEIVRSNSFYPTRNFYVIYMLTGAFFRAGLVREEEDQGAKVAEGKRTSLVEVDL